MKSYSYSKKTNGFYPVSMKEIYEASPDGWPSDAVAIEDEYYDALYMGQSQGKIITSDSEGQPVLTDPPAPTQEQWVALAEEKRNASIAEATVKIAPLQDAVDLIEATQDEKEQLLAWKKYRVLLNRTDTSSAPDIVWPQQP